jgi:hypothetical protein
MSHIYLQRLVSYVSSAKFFAIDQETEKRPGPTRAVVPFKKKKNNNNNNKKFYARLLICHFEFCKRT